MLISTFLRRRVLTASTPRRFFCDKPSGGGFFSNIRDSIERELSKNKDFKESVSKLRKDRNLQNLADKTSEATRKFAETSKVAAEKAAEHTKLAAEKAAEQTKLAAEHTKLAAEKAAEKAKLAAEKTKEAAEKTGEKSGFTDRFTRFGKSSSEAAEETIHSFEKSTSSFKKTVSSNPFVKSLSSNETLNSVSSSIKEAGLLDGWGDAARELFGAKKKVRKVQVSAPPSSAVDSDENDDDDEEENVYEGPDALTTVAQEKTGWQKFSERLANTPIIEDILSGTKKARRVVSRSKVGKAAGEAKTAVDDIKDELRERWETSQNPWVYRLSAAYVP